MKNVVIIILTMLVLGLGGFLVYAKIIDNNEVSKGKEEIKDSQKEPMNEFLIEQKDSTYFNEYLKAFLSCDGALYISRNTENFSNKDISNFVSRYYNFVGYDVEGGYKVNVSDVDALIYKYFNKRDVVLETKPNEVTTITKQDNVYKFNWEAVGCGSYGYKDSVVTYKAENVTVKYSEYDNLGERYTGKFLTFHLKYNNGNYNVIKIEG
ncbi:MAG: hypothetical protein IJE04_00360 [Bacilli bacterium]|nr:hypothetical protein [Bacilli bacterium]